MDSKKLLEQFDAFYEGVIVMVADMKSYKDMINELELKVQNQSQLILQLQEKLTTKDIIIDDKLTELHQILQRDNINLSEIIKDVNLSVQIIEFSCEVADLKSKLSTLSKELELINADRDRLLFENTRLLRELSKQ